MTSLVTSLARSSVPCARRPATELPAPVDGETAASLASRLEAASRARLGRSLAIRHIDAGSCGGCEIEIRALTNVIHDLTQFGLRFRHQSASRRCASGDRAADPQPGRGAGAGLDGNAGS